MSTLTSPRLAGVCSFGLIQQSSVGVLFQCTKLDSTSFDDTAQCFKLIGALATLQFCVLGGICIYWGYYSLSHHGASFLLELSFVRVCLSAWPSPHLCVHTVVPLVYFVSLLLLALLM